MTEPPSGKSIARIKAEFGPDGPTCYRVGLVDDEGNFRCGTLIVSVEDIQQAAFANISFTIMGETTGILLPCPSSGLAEDLLDRMFADNRLMGRPVDEVVAEALDLSMNETSDQMVTDLTELRDRLLTSLARVEGELEHHRTMLSQQDKAGLRAPVLKGSGKDDMH